MAGCSGPTRSGYRCSPTTPAPSLRVWRGRTGSIEVESVGGALFVSGTAASPAQAERVLRGVRAVSGETPVVDALALETPAQVNLEVLISEVSRNVTQQLGIDWSVDLNPFEESAADLGDGHRRAPGDGSAQR